MKAEAVYFLDSWEIKMGCRIAISPYLNNSWLRRAILCTLLVCFSANVAYAGAWLQPKGSSLFITQTSYFSSDYYFDADGNKQKQSRFTKGEAQPYAEYGLAENITLGGTLFAQSNAQEGHKKLGMADPQMFARSSIWKSGSQLISLQPLIKFPSQFRNKTTPRGGSSSTDYELSALYGRSLNLLSNRDYLDVNVGYRVRSGLLNNQYHADAALGLGLGDNWHMIPAIRATFAAKMNDQNFSQNGDLDYDLVKLELGANYQFSETRSFSISLANHVWGRQIGDGYGASIGFAQKF